jgi:hypothetical protein
MSIINNILHPVKAINNAILKNFIKDALEKLPELKQIGLNYLRTHADEILEAVKKAIISALKKFIESKTKEAKTKIVEITGNSN